MKTWAGRRGGLSQSVDNPSYDKRVVVSGSARRGPATKPQSGKPLRNVATLAPPAFFPPRTRLYKHTNCSYVAFVPLIILKTSIRKSPMEVHDPPNGTSQVNSLHSGRGEIEFLDLFDGLQTLNFSIADNPPATPYKPVSGPITGVMTMLRQQ
jgi:hypothetical protein